MLEDDFLISWYRLRPYELLEMHLAGGIVMLPREVGGEYVKPYFEARVKALRVIGGTGGDRDGEGGRVVRPGGGMGASRAGAAVRTPAVDTGKMRKGRKGDPGRSKSMDPLSSGGSDRIMSDGGSVDKGGKGAGKDSGKDSGKRERKKKGVQLEWKDRWVVVHQGVLNLCKHRLVRFLSCPCRWYSFIEIVFLWYVGPESDA
jgi:hypothetical protein